MFPVPGFFLIIGLFFSRQFSHTQQNGYGSVGTIYSVRPLLVALWIS